MTRLAQLNQCRKPLLLISELKSAVVTKKCQQQTFQLSNLVSRHVVVNLEDGNVRPIFYPEGMASEATSDAAGCAPQPRNANVYDFVIIGRSLTVKNINTASTFGSCGAELYYGSMRNAHWTGRVRYVAYPPVRLPRPPCGSAL